MTTSEDIAQEAIQQTYASSSTSKLYLIMFLLAAPHMLMTVVSPVTMNAMPGAITSRPCQTRMPETAQNTRPVIKSENPAGGTQSGEELAVSELNKVQAADRTYFLNALLAGPPSLIANATIPSQGPPPRQHSNATPPVVVTTNASIQPCGRVSTDPSQPMVGRVRHQSGSLTSDSTASGLLGTVCHARQTEQNRSTPSAVPAFSVPALRESTMRTPAVTPKPSSPPTDRHFAGLATSNFDTPTGPRSPTSTLNHVNICINWNVEVDVPDYVSMEECTHVACSLRLKCQMSLSIKANVSSKSR